MGRKFKAICCQNDTGFIFYITLNLYYEATITSKLGIDYKIFSTISLDVFNENKLVSVDYYENNSIFKFETSIRDRFKIIPKNKSNG